MERTNERKKIKGVFYLWNFLGVYVHVRYNPIVNGTQRDPSTAWQTAAGEWRLTNYEGKV